jgi:hypothetical protein
LKHRFAAPSLTLNLEKRAMAAPLSLRSEPLVLVERPKDGSLPAPRRAKIWELSRYLHCSVIGTCLSTSELRHILTKSGFITDGATDHDLHGKGVTVAGQHDVAAKLLNKALDKRHQQAINQFAKARCDVDVSTLWREALNQGHIPGAYWAALTHPATSDDLVRRMFGEVHMLSHLVGAANRADIRRLTELETENAELREKLRRQEAHLREGLSSRDTKIRDLNELLVRRIADQASSDSSPATSSEQAALNGLITELERRLDTESARRATIETRLEGLANEARRDREGRLAAETREAVLREELDALEASVAAPASASDAIDSRSGLDGVTILYVGGRPQQHAHLRQLSAQEGADIVFHDGGIEERHGLLAGLVSRCDVVVFPVDCVSHEAVTAVKRLCRNAAKPFVPLRSGGISSFLAALDRVASSQFRAEDATATATV